MVGKGVEIRFQVKKKKKKLKNLIFLLKIKEAKEKFMFFFYHFYKIVRFNVKFGKVATTQAFFISGLVKKSGKITFGLILTRTHNMG